MPDRLFDAIWRQFVIDYGWQVLHQLYWREALTYLRQRGVGTVVYSNCAHRPGIAPFRRLLARYPDLPAIVAHMGALEYRAFGELLADHPRLCLDTAFAFLPRLGSWCDLGAPFLEAHREKILYGSDFPNVLFPREDEIDTLLALNLSQEFYNAVFCGNGLRLIAQSPQRRP